jgi:hypothetical protein
MVEAISGNVNHLSKFESLHYSCEGLVQDCSKTSLSSFFKAVVHRLTSNPHLTSTQPCLVRHQDIFSRSGVNCSSLLVCLRPPCWQTMGRQVLKQQGLPHWSLADFYLATYAGCQRWRLRDPEKMQLFTFTQSMELTKGNGKKLARIASYRLWW